MKKTIYILSIGLFSLMLYSCTPQAINDDASNPQSCCGDDMHTPPLPPPPGGGVG